MTEPRAGDLGMPGLWWCWLCNTRGCAVPDGPDTTELMFDHLAREHPRIRPTEEPTLPSKLSDDRREYFERDPDPAGLPAAQIAVEHIEHHGQQLLWDGTTATGGLEDAYHRFVCAEPTCYFRMTIMVHECDTVTPIVPPSPAPETAGHVPPDPEAHFGTVDNYFCVLCGTRVGGPHGVNTPTRPWTGKPNPPPVPEPAPAPAEEPAPVTQEIAAVRPSPTPRKAPAR